MGSKPPPDAALPKATTPTLLIVGGFDAPVIQMNRDAMKRMRGEVKLEIVRGTTHLFEEPGTLERVVELAGAWFAQHLQPALATRRAREREQDGGPTPLMVGHRPREASSERWSRRFFVRSGSDALGGIR